MTYEEWRVRLWEASDPNLHTIAFIDAMVAAGDGQFWASPLSAVITQIWTYPTGFKALRTFAAAGDMDDMLTNVKPEIEAFGREAGCNHCLIEGRPGWQRKCRDYAWYQVILIKEL